MADSLDSESFALLVELREHAWSELPLRAHGHCIEMKDPDALDAMGDLVWLHLRFRASADHDLDSWIAIMPVSVLRRPDEAWMRLSVWLETWRQLLDPDRDAEHLRGLAIGYLDVRKAARLARVSEPDVLRAALYQGLARWLPVPERTDAQGRTAVERTREVLEREFPIGIDVQVQFVSDVSYGDAVEMVPGQGIRAVLRLIVWDGSGDSRMVRDIKEQHARVLGTRALFEVDRIEPYLTGWSMALEEALADPPRDIVDGIMPGDLVFGEVLDLAKPRTAEDFRDAFLARSRLGAWIPQT